MNGTGTDGGTVETGTDGETAYRGTVECGVGRIAGELRGLPTNRVVRLPAVAADDLAIALAHSAADLPAGLTYRARPAATPADFVAQVLDDLESAATGLFPAWLPGAEHIQLPGGAGLVAVRAVAAEHAHRKGYFAPFLSALAATALAGASVGCRRYPPEYRAPGLARVVADALCRDRLVVIVEVPTGLSAAGEQAVVAGSEWLVSRGRLGVWLTGTGLPSADWLPAATLSTAGHLTGGVGAAPASPASAVAPACVESALSGAPHPRSQAEQMLESALAGHDWAAGRHWNQTYQSHAMRTPIRLDLCWPREWCVVEIDGPEHREPQRFEADRRRDVQLQLDGYAILRFTNARVIHDVGAVVTQIGQFIVARRRESGKGTTWPATI